MKTRFLLTIVLMLASLFVLINCSKKTFELQSNAFENDGRIPEKYYHGYLGGRQKISLPFHWVNSPEGAQSFALVMYDPGSINWPYWVVFNIPAHGNEIAENASGNNMLEGSIELPNFRRTTPAYHGPDPELGGMPFKYIVVLYALNIDNIDVSGYKTYTEIQTLLEGKILAQAELVGFATQERQYPLFSNRVKKGVATWWQELILSC